MITTRQMIALRTSFAALAFITLGQSLEFTVQFFNLATHVAYVICNLRGQGFIRAVGYHPVNVAIYTATTLNNRALKELLSA